MLVLRLGALELPLDPARPIACRIARDGARTYTFHAAADAAGASPPQTPAAADQAPSAITLAVPLPARADPHRAESVEALDHLLAQYAELDWQTDGGAAHHEQPEGPAEAEDAADEEAEDTECEECCVE